MNKNEQQEEFELMKWVEETQFYYYMKDMTETEKEAYIMAEYRKSIPENMMWSQIIYQMYQDAKNKRKQNEQI